MSDTRTHAATILTAASPESHPFVRALNDATLTLAEARAAALEIRHVVAAFPRFLAAIIAQIPAHGGRMVLVDNLYHEHGAMDAGRVHEVTYRGFLHTLGLDEETIDAHQPGLGATVYVRALLDLCGRGTIGEALGALGIIEEIVARVSIAVRRYSEQLRTGREAHFSVHEVLDLRHADEIYALCDDHALRHDRGEIERGLALGHYYHLRLYSDVAAQLGLG